MSLKDGVKYLTVSRLRELLGELEDDHHGQSLVCANTKGNLMIVTPARQLVAIIDFLLDGQVERFD